MSAADSPCNLARRLHERHATFWHDYHQAMSNEEAFLNGDRYVRDGGAHNKDRRRTQIRGEETRSRIRHVVAKMTEKPRNITAKPLNPTTNAIQAEMAVKRLEYELSLPYKGYDEAEYEALMSACEMRCGIVWMDLDVDENEIYFAREDARRFMWDPSRPPHHPKNAWLFREKRVHVDDARATYGMNKGLEPDRGAFNGDGSLRSGVPILLGPDGRQVDAADYDDEKVTLWECWYKNDPKKKRKAAPTEEPVPEGERTMACVSCGWESPTEAEADMPFPDATGPSYGTPGCDECGGDMKRVDAKDVSAKEAAGKNHSLLIMAPLSPGPKDDPLYEGGWPVPASRSYPGLFVMRYVSPGKPMGGSDVVDCWDQQLAKDNLMTKGVQQVFKHQTYWDFPSRGINNAKGKRFQMRDDDGFIMFRDLTQSLMGSLDVKQYNASGLDPAWGGVLAQVDASLTREAPKYDVGPAESNTRDIAVGTIERQVAEAEVSTEDFRRRRNRARGMFAGVVWDYIRATDTPEKRAQLDLDGLGAMEAPLSGDEYPDCDFIIEDTPDFTGIDKARAEAATWAIQTITNPITRPYFSILAKIQQVPQSVAMEIENVTAEQEAQARMMGLPPPGAMPPGAEGDMGGGDMGDMQGGMDDGQDQFDMAGMGAQSGAF